MTDALSIDVVIAAPAWAAQPDAEQVVRRALCTAAAATSASHAELAVVLTDDSAIRALNRDWRGIDRPTNVLSFPTPQRWGPSGGGKDAAGAVPSHLGDIVIAYETMAREAEAEAKPFADHLAHLAVHGFLHLLGQDHDDDRNAEAMEGLERAILARLGIADPYAIRDVAVPTERHV